MVAKKFAPLETNFLTNPQFTTPPPLMYLLPVTISQSVSYYFFIKSAIYFGWWDKSESIIMTKFPLHNSKPSIYADPNPNFPPLLWIIFINYKHLLFYLIHKAIEAIGLLHMYHLVMNPQLLQFLIQNHFF